MAAKTRPTASDKVSDGILAAAVLAVVGLMVVPLPAWTLDILLAANLTVAALLTLAVLYVPSPLRLPSFPALLLLTTLVRLGLNVSSTRLILSQGDAGAVIRAFGSYLVRGSYVVGGVVFFILILIQFVVIVKGAERIAEVSARFTLDSLPGKQLGIDAQQRLGSLSARQANAARARLEQESQFYGAMDGAMKFVKGDAIAGAVIVLVNLCGGLLIGVFQRGEHWSDALTTYGLLTIGDGIVSQIPSLLTATAAGFLVARVATDDHSGALGSQLTNQLLAAPRALRVAAIFAGVLALLPGLPALPFLIVALLLGLAALYGARHQKTSAPPAPELTADGPTFLPTVKRWQLQVNEELRPWLTDSWSGTALRGRSLAREAEQIVSALFERRGVPLPPCDISVGPGLAAGEVRLLVREIPVATQVAPGDSARGAWLTSWVLPLLEARARDLFGVGETRLLLEQLRSHSPAVVEESVPTVISVARLTELLQVLINDGVSVRDLSGILEAVSPYAKENLSVVDLAERVRSHLQPALTYQLAGEADHLRIVTLAPELEDTVRSALISTTNGAALAIAPGHRRDFVAAVSVATKAGSENVVLTTAELRPHVQALLRVELPSVRVVSPRDVLPRLRLERIAEATYRGL